MASINVETHRAAHHAFDRRDFDAAVAACAPRIAYTDESRGVVLKTPEELRGWLADWVRAFPDAAVTDAVYRDAGSTVVAQYIGRGTNDGPIEGLRATGRRVSIAICEVMHFDADGRITGGEIYYDALSMLIQLGHVEPPG